MTKRDEKRVDVEFERSVADEPASSSDRDEVDRERHYGGAPNDDVSGLQPDNERETTEWEQRYGSEESRDKLGFDGAN